MSDAHYLCIAKVEVNGFGMANVKNTIWLWRKSSEHLKSKISLNNIFKENNKHILIKHMIIDDTNTDNQSRKKSKYALIPSDIVLYRIIFFFVTLS